MIEVDHRLLSIEALENLIIEIITRQATDYGEYELDIQTKKNQLIRKLTTGDAVIVYSEQEECCDIIRKEALQEFKNLIL